MPIEKKQKRGPRKRGPVKGKGTKYKILCAKCGKSDKVNFKPKSRNVLCKFCHRDS